MAKTTRATQFLDKAGVTYTTATYDYDPNAERIGLQAAEAIGEHPSRVLKTLMAELDGKPVCVVVPSDKEVSMKKLASAFGGKSAAMMKPANAEKLTGGVGGIPIPGVGTPAFQLTGSFPNSASPIRCNEAP